MMHHSLHIAPMMGYTHRHFRYLMRRLCPDVLLYSEMITTGALLYGDVDRYLQYDASELPVVLQLGGNDPIALAKCAKIAEERGYSQINLNVGCPSSRVREGGIGASLYQSPGLVVDCVAAMSAAVDIPVTVKCRIGVDDCDSFAHLVQFAEGVYQVGCAFLVVHARKAWLHGLNPKQNRTVPPLRYDMVRDLTAHTKMPIILNGGLNTLTEIRSHLEFFPGVMVGRYACAYPLKIYEFCHGDQVSLTDIKKVLSDYLLYMDSCVANGEQLSFLIQPLHGFFRATSGAKLWRQGLARLQKNLKTEQGKPSDYLDAILLNASF